MRKPFNKIPAFAGKKFMSYNINEKGYYGEFGGAYIPEMLYPNVEELRQKII